MWSIKELRRPAAAAVGVVPPLFLVSNVAEVIGASGGAAQAALHVSLLDPMTRHAWRCISTVHELRPAFLDPIAFSESLKQLLLPLCPSSSDGCNNTTTATTTTSSAMASDALAVDLFPSWQLDGAPDVVRLEARASAGGSSSLTVVVLHLSRAVSSEAAGDAWAAALGSLALASQRVVGLDVAAAAASRELALVLRDKDRIALERASSEATLLEGFLKILNTKKAKIRELADLLDAANAKLDQQQQAPGVAPEGDSRASSCDAVGQVRRSQPRADFRVGGHQPGAQDDDDRNDAPDMLANAEEHGSVADLDAYPGRGDVLVSSPLRTSSGAPAGGRSSMDDLLHLGL